MAQIRIRRPSAAIVVALIALFFSLTSSAVGAAIVAKARYALNAGRLQGKTAAQVAAMAGAGNRVSVATREFFATPGSGTAESVSCRAGRAIAVRWETVGGGQGVPISIQETSPTTWRVEIQNLRVDGPARGTIYLVCLR